MPENGLLFTDLLSILLPPTLFIAIMASQLRYFHPRPSDEHREGVGLEAAGEDARSLLASAHHSLQKTGRWTKKKQITTGMEDTGHGGTMGGSGSKVSGPKAANSGVAKSVSFEADDKDEEEKITPSKWEKAKQTTSELAKFAGRWLWQWILELNLLFWRLMEIHLHKIIALVLFSIVISQLGAILMVVLVMMILTSPLRQMNRFFYPFFTITIGCIVILKMIYQVPIITSEKLELSRNSCKPLVS